MTLTELVTKHRIVVTAGSGGVGKTTVAASVALWGAMQGRRAVVMTIDPAKRLAQSMGLAALESRPREIEPGLFAAQGLTVAGRLWAMMLDQKGAWDALVERYAPADARARILANPFYQHLSQAFAGSHEYMAIEQLCALVDEGTYDLIVVDTPPTRHALDFLEAPKRIGDFLDQGVIRWFVGTDDAVGWSAIRAMNKTLGFLLRRVEAATGASALGEIADFFQSMSGLFENFQGRVQRAHTVLRGAQTAFVLVSTPEEQVLDDAEYLSSRMSELHMPLKGVVLNRVHAESNLDDDDPDAVRRVVEAAGIVPGDAATLVENFLDYERLARGDALRIEQFRAELATGVPVVLVPNFATDVHDLGRLAAMHGVLFGG